ncbi:MAG: DoxX family membrane protein [Saprospiraceae bacterium]|jgi:uncharacterized membrane protein
MNSILSLGRWLYAIPLILFGAFHFMGAKDMAGMVPSYFPAKEILVYLTGAGHLAAALAIILGKYDKLGTALLGLMMVIFALTIYLPGMGAEDAMASQMATTQFLKDLMIGGAAWMYAANMAKDNSIIG